MLEVRTKRRRAVEPRRCFACGAYARPVRSGRRKDGSPWALCAQCHEAWHAERELERFTVAFLKGKGARDP